MKHEGCQILEGNLNMTSLLPNGFGEGKLSQSRPGPLPSSWTAPLCWHASNVSGLWYPQSPPGCPLAFPLHHCKFQLTFHTEIVICDIPIGSLHSHWFNESPPDPGLHFWVSQLVEVRQSIEQRVRPCRTAEVSHRLVTMMSPCC